MPCLFLFRYRRVVLFQKKLNAPSKMPIYMDNTFERGEFMYILNRCFANQGDYVVHRETGEIKYAYFVLDHGGVVVDDYYPGYGSNEPEVVVWPVNDYFVLQKVADIYFDGHFDKNRKTTVSPD